MADFDRNKRISISTYSRDLSILLSMALLTVLLLLLASAISASADKTTFDCKMRELAMTFARQIQPHRTRDQYQAIADALNGSPEAQNCNVTVPDLPYRSSRFFAFPTPQSGNVYYVDSTKGNDANPGTMDKPFKSIAKAIAAGRAATGATTIMLRAGTFYLTDTISLTTQDNDLTVQNYNGEEVWISGGQPIAPSWKPYNVSAKSTSWIVAQNENAIYGQGPVPGKIALNGTYDTWQACETMCQANETCNVWTWHDKNEGSWTHQCYFRFDGVYAPTSEAGHVSGYSSRGPNIYVADMSTSGISSIPGLRVNGARAIRARYPNANPEMGFGSTLTPNSWNPQTLPVHPSGEYNPDTPFRNTSGSFQKYDIGIGGVCEHFTPPAGYECGDKNGRLRPYENPSGMIANRSILPNSPYKNVSTAVVNVWRPAHWDNWMFEVGPYDPATGNFTFSKGGFQGAWGSNVGAEFFIENVFEELDAPMEYFYDETTRMLYYFHNATGAPTSDTQFVAVGVKVLVNATGTMASPVRNVTFRGVGFRDAAYTYLDPHGIPSGGDWGLERMGAVFVEGAEHFGFFGCVFERLDGNGIMLSGYNRYATVEDSEFAWIGSSAIASWGYTTGSPVPGMGPDGTGGTQPRFSQILNNFVRELGIWEKQSSFYFQAKSCQNLLAGNIFFNGPRAGINFNDGFGGGSNLTMNLLFNTCRESGDHGPFNSWDRQVYVTKVNNGSTSVVKAYDTITRNFVIANYDSQEAIDNDDGSCYYETYKNFFAYSGNGMKNDFGGHDNHHHDNIYAYVGRGFGICAQLPGHEDYFYNNTVVLNGDGAYGSGACSGDAMPVVHDNKIFSPNANISECGMPLAKWQSMGHDHGTTAAKWPDDDQLVQWIKDTLSL